MKIKDILEKAIEIVYDGGKFTKNEIFKVTGVYTKSSSADVVTNVDIQVQEMMVSRLHEVLPEAYFLVEEDITDKSTLFRHKVITLKEFYSKGIEEFEYLWILDPIDGTTNYSHSLPIYSCSLALYRYGEALFGIIYSPSTSEMYHAVKGKGAYLNNTPINVSSINSFKDALGVTGYPYDTRLNDKTRVLIDLFSQDLQELRILGSSALEMCYIASGRLDMYWEAGLKPWDTAAGHLIVREAGGKVTDFKGDDYTIFSPDIIATNGVLHDRVLNTIKEFWI